MYKLKHWIRIYFGLTPRETNGFVVLFFTFILILISPVIYRAVYHPITPFQNGDSEKLDSLVTVIESQLDNQKLAEGKKKGYPKQKDYEKTEEEVNIQLFPFNPNTISLEEWQKLGVKKYVANNAMKYLSKGGKFRIKSDLQKVYGLDEETFQTLKSYIQLPEKYPNKAFTQKEGKFDSEKTDSSLSRSKEEKTFDKAVISPFDINMASAEDFQQIRGIGTKTSNTIINFRNKLGGFYSIDQLSEVYGLKLEVFEELKKYSLLNDGNVQKIKLNQASEQMLKAHPYISPNLARVIVNYRKQHGNYNAKEDLAKIRILKPETLEKLLPYLEF